MGSSVERLLQSVDTTTQRPALSSVDRLLQGEDTTLTQAVRLGQQEDPAKAGRALGLSKKTGLPLEVTHRNVDLIDNEEQRKGIAELSKQYPSIARYLSAHPLNAAVAMPDLSTMKTIEAAATAISGRQASHLPTISATGFSSAPRSAGNQRTWLVESAPPV